MPLSAPAGCNANSTIAKKFKQLALLALPSFKDIELPPISENLEGFVSASLDGGKLVGFSDLKIEEVCVVESEKNGSFYSAVKLPQVNGRYDIRYN